MKTNLILTLFLFSLSTLQAQGISQASISASGGYTINEQSYSLSWTMGQVFSQTARRKHHLTEGFQQGELRPNKGENRMDAETKESQQLSESSVTNNVSVYPTLVTDQVNLHFSTAGIHQVKANIFNSQGQLVKKISLVAYDQQVVELTGLNDLTKGTYYLQIETNSKTMPSTKIIKT